MTCKHRGIKLKSYDDGDRGFRELLGIPLEEAEPVDDSGSDGAFEPAPVMTPRQVIARGLREELEAALQILEEALEEVARDVCPLRARAEKP